MGIKEKFEEWIQKALILLDYVISIIRPHVSFLRPWAPPYTPVTWIYINGTCCMLTAMFFLLGWLPKNTLGYDFAQMTYIPFNLLFCVIWFIEASLWILFDEESPQWHKLGEVILATFFVLDGIFWVYGWLFLEEPLNNQELLIYTAIDFLIYLFYLVLAIREEAKATQEALRKLQKEQDLEAASTRGNVGSTRPTMPIQQNEDTQTDFKLMT